MQKLNDGYILFPLKSRYPGARLQRRKYPADASIQIHHQASEPMIQAGKHPMHKNMLAAAHLYRYIGCLRLHSHAQYRLSLSVRSTVPPRPTIVSMPVRGTTLEKYGRWCEMMTSASEAHPRGAYVTQK